MAEIRDATAGDLEDVVRLLGTCRLPVDDVAEHVGAFVVAEAPDGLVACGGLEFRAPDALLRSLAVAPSARRQGLGRLVCEALFARAARQGVRTCYLLTESAAPFFGTLGFEAVDRAQASAGIRSTREFRELCPDSAQLMRRPL